MTPQAAGIVLKDIRPGQHRAACPACRRQRRDDALSVKVDADGGFVAYCHRCGFSASSGRVQRPQAPRPTAQVCEAMPTLAPRWRASWQACAPVRGTLGETYLRRRGCVVPPADGDLRYAPAAWHWPSSRELPALVALLTDAVTGEPRSLHFTFLAADGRGKADVERAKLLLAGHRKAGAVVRLWPDEAVTTGLCIAEGIETALSAAHAFTPVWAAVDAGNLAQLPVLAGVEALTIAADNDNAGTVAGVTCARRWSRAARLAYIVTAAQPGADLNDLVAA